MTRKNWAKKLRIGEKQEKKTDFAKEKEIHKRGQNASISPGQKKKRMGKKERAGEHLRDAASGKLGARGTGVRFNWG